MKPSPVRPNEKTKRVVRTVRREPALKENPTSGARKRSKIAWIIDNAVPPAIFPSAMLERGTGATITDWRKPSRRSSMIDIVEKIAVNSRIITTTPGKKYSSYGTDPPGTGGWNEALRPEPKSAQNRIG